VSYKRAASTPQQNRSGGIAFKRGIPVLMEPEVRWPIAPLPFLRPGGRAGGAGPPAGPCLLLPQTGRSAGSPPLSAAHYQEHRDPAGLVWQVAGGRDLAAMLANDAGG